MAWKVKGKIAGHYPGRNNPNLDIYNIGYVPAGSNQAASDILDVKKVYYIPKDYDYTQINQSNFENFKIWEKYWDPDPVVRTLTMDTEGYVTMEYIPSANKTVNSIGIHTTGTNQNGRCAYIFNNDGILLAKSQNESQVNNTKYSLDAYTRTMTFDNPITLVKDKTYWITYHFENCNNAANSYFENEYGDYKRLTFSNTNASTYPAYASKNVHDLTSATMVYDLVAGALDLSANEVFKSGIQVYSPFQWGNAGYYSRTTAVSGDFYNNIIVKSGTKVPSVTDLSGVSTNQLFMVRDANGEQPAVAFDVYRYIYNGTLPENDTEYSNKNKSIQDLADIFADTPTKQAFKFYLNEHYSWVYVSYPFYPNGQGGGSQQQVNTYYEFIRTNQGGIGFSKNDSPVSNVSAPILGYMYHKASQTTWPGCSETNEAIVVCTDNTSNNVTFELMTEFDQEFTLSNNTKVKFFTPLDQRTIYENVTTQCGGAATGENVTVAVDLTTAQTETTRLHYLEINGVEVPQSERRIV